MMHFGNRTARYSTGEIAYIDSLRFLFFKITRESRALIRASGSPRCESGLLFSSHDVQLFDAIGELCKMLINTGNNNLGVDAMQS